MARTIANNSLNGRIDMGLRATEVTLQRIAEEARDTGRTFSTVPTCERVEIARDVLDQLVIGFSGFSSETRQRLVKDVVDAVSIREIFRADSEERAQTDVHMSSRRKTQFQSEPGNSWDNSVAIHENSTWRF